MVGGGQLARMTHQAAIALGQDLRVLVNSADDPAAQVTPNVVIGSHTDLDDLRRIAAGADVVTFDHEHVPAELLDKLVAEGVVLAPPPQALVHAQDKLVMRRRLQALDVPVPRYLGIHQLDELGELDAFARELDAPLVVKAVRGGYDGRGVQMARDLADARDIASGYLAGVFRCWWRSGSSCVESSRRWWRARRSARGGVAGGRDGAAGRHLRRGDRASAGAVRASWRRCATAGAAVGRRTGCGRGARRGALRDHRRRFGGQRACDAAAQLRALDHGRIAHQPVRAALTRGVGLPARRYRGDRAGDRDDQRVGAAAQPAMSLDERLHNLFARMPDARVHLYGKDERPGRKVGHINFLGFDPAAVAGLREQAELAAHWLSHGQWTDGWDPHG